MLTKLVDDMLEWIRRCAIAALPPRPHDTTMQLAPATLRLPRAQRATSRAARSRGSVDRHPTSHLTCGECWRAVPPQPFLGEGDGAHHAGAARRRQDYPRQRHRGALEPTWLFGLTPTRKVHT